MYLGRAGISGVALVPTAVAGWASINGVVVMGLTDTELMSGMARRVKKAGSRHAMSRSEHRVARVARRVYWGMRLFSLPAPRGVVVPVKWGFVLGREVAYWVRRVFIAEPIFKAYCTRCGRNVHTDIYVHWIRGKGELIVGDDVTVDGKVSFTFASRFTASPRFEIGDRTGIGHAAHVTIGKRITIGKDCRIAANVTMLDSSGHPADPEMRRRGMPPADEEVRPITIEDNVWIGRDAIILPGVTIGEGSIVSAGAVVMTDVAPYSVVAGNPARKIKSLAVAPGGPAAGAAAGGARIETAPETGR